MARLIFTEGMRVCTVLQSMSSKSSTWPKQESNGLLWRNDGQLHSCIVSFAFPESDLLDCPPVDYIDLAVIRWKSNLWNIKCLGISCDLEAETIVSLQVLWLTDIKQYKWCLHAAIPTPRWALNSFKICSINWIYPCMLCSISISKHKQLNLPSR